MKYDFIIIGAGTAGCVLAYRLSEDPKNSVLLIEAGPGSNIVEVNMPIGYPKVQKTKRDWQYFTTPQTELNGRSLYQPRGKMIGGTGSMNGMIYIRGHQSDFDEWSESTSEEWNFQNVLPYFKKSEANKTFENHYHSSNGLLPVTSHDEIHPLNEVFIEAARETGFEINDDFNGKVQDGIGYFQSNILNGNRQSTANTFLKQAKERPNLKVLKNSEVSKIVVAEKRATGVFTNSSDSIIEVGREIILSAGAINSPKLLLLSGVGERNQLERLGIDVKLNRPGVGKNLQDHIQYFVSYSCKGIQTLNTCLTFGNLYKYFVRRKGIMASAIAQAGGFFKTRSELTKPDMQFHFVPGLAGEDIHDLKNQPKIDGYMLGLTLLRPESRGSVHLDPSDPTNKPLIDPGFLKSNKDLDSLVEAFQFAEQLMESDAFGKYRLKRFSPAIKLKDRNELISFIRAGVESVYHSVGTCKMGRDDDSVVDEQLKVHGLENLRIADASIMPTITGGNINAAIIMIAEKAADFALGNDS